MVLGLRCGTFTASCNIERTPVHECNFCTRRGRSPGDTLQRRYSAYTRSHLRVRSGNRQSLYCIIIARGLSTGSLYLRRARRAARDAPTGRQRLGESRMNDQKLTESPGVIATGIEGLDEVLRGGLIAERLYLVEGHPGSGKTTLALQFLLAGVERGERCLFVTLSETEAELRASAASHGWSLYGIDIFEIAH